MSISENTSYPNRMKVSACIAECFTPLRDYMVCLISEYGDCVDKSGIIDIKNKNYDKYPKKPPNSTQIKSALGTLRKATEPVDLSVFLKSCTDGYRNSDIFRLAYRLRVKGTKKPDEKSNYFHELVSAYVRYRNIVQHPTEFVFDKDIDGSGIENDLPLQITNAAGSVLIMLSEFIGGMTLLRSLNITLFDYLGKNFPTLISSTNGLLLEQKNKNDSIDDLLLQL